MSLAISLTRSFFKICNIREQNTGKVEKSKPYANKLGITKAWKRIEDETERLL